MKNNRTMKACLYAFVLLFSALNALSAQGKKAAAVAPTTLLTAKDSVFMFVKDGQKLLMHRVKKGQTLYSIAKFYGVTTDELLAFNPWYKADTTVEAQNEVLVPIPNKAINRYVAKDKLKKYAPLYYVAQAGDNLYSISKKYLDMPVEEVKKRNKLTSETIELGQLIHVGWVPTTGIPREWRAAATTATTTAAPKGVTAKGADASLKKHKAMWVKDKKSVTGNFCLTNEAKKGEVVLISNPVSKKTVEVTVVGKLNIVKDTKVKIVLSEQAAQALGLTEKENLVTIEVKK
jgi:LysM repeat protein